eukprot:comp24146_c2_seq1/m.43922 comp24146_c2_seq1/g.43922  ORF comp24146_c2_seq1/g.43922 comp24146_c2_seq1/m.43922 type:complete len:698 (-) comp24146_c2_seq1:1517-3610(-)
MEQVPPYQQLQIGDRVYIGRREGTLRFLGPTQFAAGEWAGVELQTAEGKNDGSVQGVRYFVCPPNHGVFIQPGKLTVPAPTPRAHMQTPKALFSPMSAPGQRYGVHTPTLSQALASPRGSLESDGGLHVGGVVVVGGSKRGILRFLGPTQFADGIWAGVELDEPAGKNDGAVAGVIYFSCPPKHGLFCPPNKVTPAPFQPPPARPRSPPFATGNRSRPTTPTTSPPRAQSTPIQSRGSTARQSLVRSVSPTKGTPQISGSLKAKRHVSESSMGGLVGSGGSVATNPLQAAYDEIANQLAASNDRVKDLEFELETFKSLLANQADELTSQINERTSLVDALTTANAQLGRELEDEREAAALERQRLDAEIEKTREEIREIQAVQGGSQEESAREMERLRVELEGERQNAQRKDAELRAQEEKLEALIKAAEESKRLLSELQSTLANERENAAAEFSAMETAKNAAQDEIAKIRQTLEEGKSDVNSVIEEKTNEIERLMQELEQARSDKELANQERENIAKQMEEEWRGVREEMERERERAEGLNGELEKEREEGKRLAVRMAELTGRLKTQVEEGNSALANAQSEAAKWEQEAKAANEKLLSVESSMTGGQSDIADLQSKIQQLRSDLSDKQILLDQSQNEIHKLTESLAEAEGKLAMTRRTEKEEKSEMELEIERLKKEVEELAVVRKEMEKNGKRD